MGTPHFANLMIIPSNPSFLICRTQFFEKNSVMEKYFCLAELNFAAAGKKCASQSSHIVAILVGFNELILLTLSIAGVSCFNKIHWIKVITGFAAVRQWPQLRLSGLAA
jgi:hypothetical protein